MYDAPDGSVATSALRKRWNQEIEKQFSLQKKWKSRFFSVSHTALKKEPVVQVKWFADPAEPDVCSGTKLANNLTDWHYTLTKENKVHWHYMGRRMQNEYCEFGLEIKPDHKNNHGAPRVKRVHVTTELRAWWVLAAMHDPKHLQKMAASIIGRPPSWEELYGVKDPMPLSPTERETLFCLLHAGSGELKELRDRGIPEHPSGHLNNQFALFMNHPINGLDDLLYIVMFGAHPYAQLEGDSYYDITHTQLFRKYEVERLACRHADPAAAMAAYETAWEGRTIAFANPMCVKMMEFTRKAFRYKGKPVPERWEIGRAHV